MRARETEFVVFDVETTGLSALDGDRIIEIGAIKVKNGTIVDTFQSLVNPERDIPFGAQQVHHITDAMVATAPTAEDVLPKMIDFIGGACVAGHNVKFDLVFLCYQLSLMGRKLNSGTPALDTLKMSRALLPQLTSYKLSYLANAFGIQVSTTHRALADVELTMHVLGRLLDIAVDRRMESLAIVLDQFGVEKPNYRIQQFAQEFLF